MSERKQFTRIKGPFSTMRYIPRAGKIRLGLKVASTKNPGKTFPKNVDYFVCPQEVTKQHGAEPIELPIMFPVEDEEVFFPQRLEWWKASGLACHGNGQEAQRWDPDNKTWIDRTCPCEHFKDDNNPTGECSERGHLLVLLPAVSMGSCYQIDTGSYHGVVNINSMIATIRGLIGRVALVPLILRRVVRELVRDGKREKKAILELAIDPMVDTPEGVNRMREETRRVIERQACVRLEGPKEEAPTEGPPDVYEEEGLPEPPVDVEPLPEPPPLTLTLNPSGEERERQARLADPPEAAPVQAGELLPDMPPARGPLKKTPGRPAGEMEWDLWHNGAIQDMARYEKTCQTLNIPMGKPINRAMRAAFRKQFDELAVRGA